MKALKRLFQAVILLPIAMILIALGVANRHSVKLALDPFSPEAPALDFQVPLFVVIFGALICGVLVGGVMAWLKQSRHRRAARDNRYEARKWRGEADRQQKRVEKMAEDTGKSMPALPAPGNDDSAKPAA